MIGVPTPSPRADSISFQPSMRGSIRSTTHTSGASKRRRRRPASPSPTTTGSKPATERWCAMPCAITSSSSTIRTFAILAPIMENHELEAERGRRLLEESEEIVLVLDEKERLVGASRRARETLEGLKTGKRVPAGLLEPEPWRPRRVAVELDGRRESLVYLRPLDQLAAYEPLRAASTAAVSHELRTPLARLLALLETATLPSANVQDMIERAK